MAIACADRRDPLALYSVAQIRAIESAALATVPPGMLMQRAGAAVARAALSRLSDMSPATRLLIVAGPGNNGGDALVAAALLAQQRLSVTVVFFADEHSLPEDAREALRQARKSGVAFATSASDVSPSSWALAIDGMFGIGLARPLHGPYAEMAHHDSYGNAFPCFCLKLRLFGVEVINHKGKVRCDVTWMMIAGKG